MRWAWTVTSCGDPGLRADRTILDALEKGLGLWKGENENAPIPAPCSRSRLQKLIDGGAVTLDGHALTRPGEKLKPGTRVEIEFPKPLPLEALPEDKPIDILFEDEHLLVVNKPARLTVHPSETQATGTLVNILLHHIKDLSGIGGVLRPGIVHRIDKNTSGALVVTKTDLAHRRLVEVFSRHEIERAYWALCYGSPRGADAPARIDGRIGRNPNDRKKMTVLAAGGRSAVTHYRRLEEFGVPGKAPFASRIEATLETGRTHQVRVHLTSVGHSILGDPSYGTPTDKQVKWLALPPTVREAVRAMPGQALHARLLGFEHPVTGERLRFEAEPPAEFRALLAALSRFG